MADYRKMWEDLGMNVDKHDLLCEALPDAFGGIYLSQEKRPEGMNYFNFVVAEIHGVRPAELLEHQARGGKVFGTFCVYVPDEVVFAAGGIATGLCGGSQFWVPAGESVLPVNTCPLIKASVGARLDRTCPFFRIADMYVGETTCDGKKKAWEILAGEVPFHVMDVPQMKRPQDIGRWADEIKGFIKVVEEFTGNRVTPEALHQSIVMLNNKRRALKRLYETRKADPVPISGKDALLATEIAFYDDPSRFTEMTNNLCEELEQRVKRGEGVFPAGAPRIMITGTPMAIPNWKLHHLVESAGAPVVVEESCTGTRYFEHLVEEEPRDLDGQIIALAERYMKTNCACFTPNSNRIQDILRLAQEYRVDGIIDYNLQFCGLYSTESYLVKQALDAQGIPYLHIETDYSEQDFEQLRTRVEAFLERLRK
ncbi:MAG: 2-hydroxyacyl-CoA dehydratase [Syntrophothermus sp.]|uniref:double-cubane-cluster-containing anaerobic reductase n=1 Tax=Syntrophothermus sp. TaxID=2736299 RepID=UPI00257BA1C2|nr:double-cubane-cluster-containing anaerobic reductase [Syntrophothermus sp.]NSW81718.1 2-hydroxyacyl-CoA dehydratase [Syntrophothermus sp.]